VKNFLLFFVLVFLMIPSVAQELTQTVKGSVADRFTGAMISGANIKLTGKNGEKLVQSSEQGLFNIDVPVGRYILTISHTAYESYASELLVIAAHQSIIKIELTPGVTVLDEVSVSGTVPVDDDVPGLRSLSIEKTLRIPANFLDPVRAITAYPGVVATNDQSNTIMVHGNSPNGLLWRLNGLDIVNPNHLANAGTLSDRPVANGGGVNILSAQMLDRTDFYLGALPAHYGNATAGVIDMGLRSGNKDDHQFTGQASVIGLDFAAEGPLGKKHNNSFLANYRYSTVGLLSAMGVDFGGEAITFQDFSFNTTFNQNNGGVVSLFGLGGISRNEFNAKDTVDREEDKDWFNIDYDATTYVLGATYAVPFRNGGRFSAGLSFSSTEQRRNSDIPIDANSTLAVGRYAFKRNLFSGFLRYSKRIGDKTILEVGTNVSNTTDDLSKTQVPLSAIFDPQACTSCPDYTTSGDVSSFLLQPYLSLHMAFSSNAGMIAGFRFVSYSYSTNSTKVNTIDSNAEPRVSLYLHPSARSSINLAYSLSSQVQLPFTSLAPGNQTLGLTRAHQINLSYRTATSGGLEFTSQVFYQQLFDVPVGQLSDAYFSTLNLIEEDTVDYLIQEGTGQNYGIDLSIEKSFQKQHYFLLGGSYYNSTYTTSDDQTYDTRFNGNYTINAVYGKEWTKPSKNRTIGVNTRLLYLGGLREHAIDEQASADAYETVYDHTNPFSEKLADYFRIDLRVSFRKNKPGYTRTFAIDIQNLLGTENEAYHKYEFSQQRVITKYQLGLIPVIVYRIDF
jgi:hypothetical protein